MGVSYKVKLEIDIVMMNKEQKNYIEEMTSKFENSKAVMVTHYQGLTMTQLDELRAKWENMASFSNYKNKSQISFRKNKVQRFMNLFTGLQQLHLERTL